MVEPNVKEGKGGLRDLQSLFWIAKYVHHVETTAELVAKGVFRPDEYATFARAENFLWAVRCHMHLLTGRATEQLSFDLQVQVARPCNTRTAKGAVRWKSLCKIISATPRVGDLTRIILTALEATHAKDAPLLERIFRKRPRIKPEYRVVHNRLALKSPDSFIQDKLNILRIFEEALRTGLLIHPDAMRLISANLDKIDDDMRNNPTAQRIFVDLLLKHGNPERALRRMNELGVLAAFIPNLNPSWR
jgi:[protein-PII] uridylyltransferase